MSKPLREGFNKCGLVVGVSEAGKSTLAREIVVDWLERDRTSIALVHDEGRKWRKAGLPSFDSWEAYVAASGGGEHPIRAAGFACPWSELVTGIITLGTEVNAEEDVRVPILVVADETSGVDSSGRTYTGRDDYKLFTQRRHYGCAILANLQRVSNFSETLWGQATNVFAFRIANEKDAQLISTNTQIPVELLLDAMHYQQGDYANIELRFDRRVIPDRLWVFE